MTSLIALLTLLLPALPSPPAAFDGAAYPWLDEMDEKPPMVRLDARFAPPAGFVRVEAAPESFAGWLRGLPVRTDRTHVLAYDKRRLLRPSAAVVALDVSTRDLQQCADTALRLHAEWLWHRGRAGEAAYHFTSGDRSRFADWKAGERFRVKGSKVERVRTGRRGGGRKSFRAWLEHTFMYAGTQSLRRDAKALGDAPFVGGEVLVQPGGPGHAVVVLDVAVHPDGRRVGLIGQGFMPAEDLHVLQMPGAIDGVWFALPADGDDRMQTPSWPTPFGRAHAIVLRGSR